MWWVRDDVPPGARPASARRCRRRSTTTSRRWSTTRAARCWCSPAPAPARPRRWSRRSPTGSRRGADPATVLVLTFSRKAAEQLRDRITARLGRTIGDRDALDVPLLLLRPGPARTPRRPLRRAAAAAVARPSRTSCCRSLLADAPRVGRVARRAAAGASAPAASPTRSSAVLARAREMGLDAAELRQLGRGRTACRSSWRPRRVPRAVPDVSSTPRALLDYAELIHRAVLLAEPPTTVPTLRAQYAHVFVDEYQDTDPRQVRLLQALAGDGRDLIVVGDPDQSIYAFRGADVRGILDFPDAVPRRRRQPRRRRSRSHHPPVRRRGCCRRPGGSPAGSPLRRLHRRARRRAASPAPGRSADRHGRAASTCSRSTPTGAETEHIADLLRRAHLEDGVPWSRDGGAGPVRAARRSRRCGGRWRRRRPRRGGRRRDAAVARAAVQPLLTRCGGGRPRRGRPRRTPTTSTPPRSRCCWRRRWAASTRPTCARSAAPLRAREQARAAAGSARPRPVGRAAPRGACSTPTVLAGVDDATGRRAKARSLGRLLARAPRGCSTTAAPPRRRCGRSGPAPAGRARLPRGRRPRRRQAARGPPRPRRRLCALFEAAARAEEQRGHTSVGELPRRAARPADPRRHPRRARRPRRRRPAADRPPVQGPGVAPGRRRRRPGGARGPTCAAAATLLQADRIGRRRAGAAARPRRELLAEERRLFYVACTRAPRAAASSPRSRRPTTTASSRPGSSTSSAREASARQSRDGRPRRPLSLAGLVAELRRTVADPRPSPSRCARPPPRRLAALAAEHRADGVRWCPPPTRPRGGGPAARAVARQPLRPGRRAGRAVGQRARRDLLQCPAKWFLGARRAASRASSQSQGFGNVVHALADQVAQGELDGRPPTRCDELMAHVDAVWDQLAVRTPVVARPRAARRCAQALAPVPAWHRAPEAAHGGRPPSSGCAPRSTLPDGAAGRCCAATPTGSSSTPTAGSSSSTSRPASTRPTDKELAENPQLGLYQLAVDARRGRRAAAGERRRAGRRRARAAAQRDRRASSKVQAAGAAGARRRRAAAPSSGS